MFTHNTATIKAFIFISITEVISYICDAMLHNLSAGCVISAKTSAMPTLGDVLRMLCVNMDGLRCAEKEF